jgi:hypothetical protein
MCSYVANIIKACGTRDTLLLRMFHTREFGTYQIYTLRLRLHV